MTLAMELLLRLQVERRTTRRRRAAGEEELETRGRQLRLVQVVMPLESRLCLARGTRGRRTLPRSFLQTRNLLQNLQSR